MTERGKIRNRIFAAQLRDFSGLRVRNITPTDLDGGYDIGGRVYVFLETKYKDTALKGGQRLFFTRLCQDLEKVGRTVFFLVGNHMHESSEDIICCDVEITEYWFDGSWRKPRKRITFRQAQVIIHKRHDSQPF